MTTLNCTAKLAKRLPFSFIEAPRPSNNLLGPWCANTFNIGQFPCIIITNEKTLLTVVLPFKDIRTFWPRFLQSLERLFKSIGVSSHQFESEFRKMQTVQFARQTNRRVLGSMNDSVHLVKAQLDQDEKRSLDELSVSLAEVPCGPLKMECPKDEFVRILQQSLPRP